MCKISWSNSKKRREEFPGTQFLAFNLNQPVDALVFRCLILVRRCHTSTAAAHTYTRIIHAYINADHNNIEDQRPNGLVGWTVTGLSLAGRLHSLSFCQWVSSRKSHTTRSGRRGHVQVAISTAPDLSGSGRVDMLTLPVAAARAAVATGATHMYLIRGSVGASFIFTHPPEDKKNNTVVPLTPHGPIAAA